MSSSTTFDSDAAYARQLQDEELAQSRQASSSISSQSAARRFEYAPPVHVKSNGNSNGSGISSTGNGEIQRSAFEIEGVPSASAPSASPLHREGEGEMDANNFRDPNAAAPDRVNRPLLARAMSNGPIQNPGARAVHANAAQQASQIQDFSPRILVMWIIYGVIEVIAAWVILGIGGWNESPEKPLRVFILVYSFRWFLTVPLSLIRYKNREVVYSEENPDIALKYLNWVKFLIFIWMIVGQYWYFTSSGLDDAPYISKFTLAVIIMFYAAIFAPLIILIMMCLCLPCVLIVLTFFQTNPGASQDVIAALPKRTFQPPAGGYAEGEEAPSCSVCMEDYVAGAELRTLPCRHEFHTGCVDRWLALNQSCPLCRAKISGEGAAAPAEANGADHV